MILTMEGLMYPTLEDEYSTLACEPTHTAEDEAYYTDEILAGWHDQGEADYGDQMERDFDPDYEGMRAGDAWERAFWGD